MNQIFDPDLSPTTELITLRQRVAELEAAAVALSARDEGVRRLMENASDIIFRYEFRPEPRFTYVSPAVTAITGYTPAEYYADPDLDRKLVHPDDHPQLEQIYHSPETPHEPMVIRYIRKDGVVVWLELNYVTIFDEAGQPFAMEGIKRNTTRRKEAEIALRIQHDLAIALSASHSLDEAGEHVLKAALQIGSIDCGGLYLVDPTGGGLDLLIHRGVSAQFVACTSHYDADAPQLRPARSGQPLYGSYTDIRPTLDEGRQQEGLRAFAFIPILYQDELIATLNLASHTLDDIPPNIRSALETLAMQVGSTLARLRSEAALAQSRQNLQKLFDTIEDFLFVLDDKGYIRQVNATTCQRLGYTAQELVGRHVLEVHPPDRRDEAAEIIAAMLAGRRDYCPVPLCSRDGILIPVETRVAQGLWDGQPALFGVSRDITERKQAEAERERLIADLEAKNAELERFTYTVSHDLKSPLITIQGFLGFLEKDALAGKIDRLKADISRIKEATDKMRRLLEDLLKLSRVGQLVRSSQNIPFETIVNEALELVHGRLAERGVQVELASELPVVYGDRARLVEVVQNLVDNAVKFMGDRPEPGLKIGGREGEGETICYVQDNGVGIEPGDQQKIFGLFERLDPHTEGTGIGLALVQRIVELHGGRIWVESQGRGQGSTFYIALPLAPAPDQPAREES